MVLTALTEESAMCVCLLKETKKEASVEKWFDKFVEQIVEFSDDTFIKNNSGKGRM